MAELCMSGHQSPDTGECAAFEVSYDSKDCESHEDCRRKDGSIGTCKCKQWWDGNGAPGFCELHIPDTSKPALSRYWELRVERCHHQWTDERCAAEEEQLDLLRQVNAEKDATQDPTRVPDCGLLILDENIVEEASFSVRGSIFLLVLVGGGVDAADG